MLSKAVPTVPVTGAVATSPTSVFDVVESDTGPYFRIVASGTWTADVVEPHFVGLQRAIAQARTGDQGIRIYVDLRQSVVESPETAERWTYWTKRIYMPHDRVAVVVASSLQKGEVRRVDSPAQRELFLSPSAALTWLLAGA